MAEIKLALMPIKQSLCCAHRIKIYISHLLRLGTNTIVKVMHKFMGIQIDKKTKFQNSYNGIICKNCKTNFTFI